MARVIAGVYEIQQKIGSGGGGVVYLGRHLRLNKLVVLKADKRSLNTKPEILRREVDMLKGLSHRYIPQVYDFVQEDGIVYTVMDYIEGESLDHILERGQTPPQSQLIQWACQLLEALQYLHSQPPHGILHADIKPANIMLRPNGDLCLIDYNIALALGEDGAVKVGYSSGYASPEHYGLDERMQIGSESSASSDGFGSSGIDSSSVGRKRVKLDARSDLYSLGATLYHLISGVKPSPDARQIRPLGKDVCSPAVARIIQKAMEPEPEKRYQSAEEMLQAFRELHTKDPRVLRHKKRIAITMTGLVCLFLAGGAAAFVGLKQKEQRQEALALSEYSAGELAKGNRSEAVRLAMEAIPREKSIWNAPITAQARKALTDALGVYELSDRFQPLDSISLSGSPYSIKMSPDGTRLAVVCQQEMVVYDLESGGELAKVQTAASALAEVTFTDSDHILYAGENGVSLYEIPARRVIWTAGMGTGISLSEDKTRFAVVDRNEEKAVIYDAEDGSQVQECSFDGHQMRAAYNDIFTNPQNDIFALNKDGTMLAVNFSGGAFQVLDVVHPENSLYIYEASSYEDFEGGFCGKWFAFVASKSDQSVFGIIDTESGSYVGELESRNRMHIQTEKDGIWLSEGNLLVRFDPESLEDQEMAFTDQEKITGFTVSDNYVMTKTDSGQILFFDRGANQMSAETIEEPMDFMKLSDTYAVVASRNEPRIRVWKLENHGDQRLFAYDARYPHDEARVSGNGTSVMLYNYEGYEISDKQGNVMSQGTFPDPEKIYDQQYRRNGEIDYLEVIWYDGTVRKYDPADGRLLSEEQQTPPEKDLYEEFKTSRYRFASELHSAPKVYDLENGTFVKELEKEAYLTYVTEYGDYLVTEYVSADGARYGLLLNQDLETLAYLPDLCDMVDGTLIFDEKNGELRSSPIYSLEELLMLAEKK